MHFEPKKPKSFYPNSFSFALDVKHTTSFFFPRLPSQLLLHFNFQQKFLIPTSHKFQIPFLLLYINPRTLFSGMFYHCIFFHKNMGFNYRVSDVCEPLRILGTKIVFEGRFLLFTFVGRQLTQILVKKKLVGGKCVWVELCGIL